MNDVELARHAESFRRGDRESFRILVGGMTRRLIAIAYRYTGDWETARDITQETWIRVYEKIESYDPSRNFSAWLHGIHRNRCLSHLRRASVRRERAFAPEDVGRIAGAASEDDPHRRLERKELGESIAAALGRLAESQRRVFSLVVIERVNPKEAARLLGMKDGTLRSTLHFARRRIAGLLKEKEALP